MTSAPGPVRLVGPTELGRPNALREVLREPAAALLAGDLVVIPTETVYGLAARPDLPEATARVFAAKRRPRGLSLPVLASSADEAWSLGSRTPEAGRLAAAFWPGPLTLVMARTDRSRPWDLGERPESIAVRVPDHPVARALLQLTGPLAVTSANISGQPPAQRPDDLIAVFGDQVAIYVIAARGSPPGGGRPSTVVDLTPATPRILRQGAISAEEVGGVLGDSLPRRNR